MTDKDSRAIGEIYENTNFKSSYDKSYDPWVTKQKAKVESICHALEHKLEGTISYYNHHKDKFFENPNDLNHAEALENMFNHLKEPLYPYQEMRYDEKPYTKPQGSKLFKGFETKKTN